MKLRIEEVKCISETYPDWNTIALMLCPQFSGYCKICYLDENNNDVLIEELFKQKILNP